VDRKALLNLDIETSLSGRDYIAPRNPIEVDLVNIWAEILSLEQVGVFDNFFELGGHSLIATQIISRIRQVYPVELPLRKIFEAPTIAGLAELIAVEIAKQFTDDELDDLLSQIDELADEDITRLLKDESDTTPTNNREVS
jgi:acyl carrier protein